MGRARTVIISAAEVSGDVFGAALAREIARFDPDVAMVGIGGPRMRSAGVEVLDDITGTSVLGFFDGIRFAPRYAGGSRALRRALRDREPAAAIGVDAPGLNLPFLARARRRGVKTAYHVCPQTWLWNPKTAVARLRQAADVVVATVPAEAALYRSEGLRTIYRGHPVVDVVDPGIAPGAPGAADAARPVRLGLLPGSRHHEIARLLPRMIAVARLLGQSHGPVIVNVGVAAPQWRGIGASVQRGLGPGTVVHEDTAAGVLRSSHVTLAASGTVLLEACLLDALVVMTYRIDAVSHFVAKHLLRVHEKFEHYALPNILAGERAIPEFVQADARPELIVEAVRRLIDDGEERRRVREAYARVRRIIGEPGVTGAIARDLVDALGV